MQSPHHTVLADQEVWSLKPAKLTLSRASMASGKGYEKYLGCGHVYHQYGALSDRSSGNEPQRPGTCGRCWALLVWDGRRLRIGTQARPVRRCEDWMDRRHLMLEMADIKDFARHKTRVAETKRHRKHWKGLTWNNVHSKSKVRNRPSISTSMARPT
ncbi:hypothetical protein JX266_005746 [Neoarthrinium moseri]|uniref:uncharacterized protein n=1 Tax=Neoarthrinium moseri TaxID=1658444 RepID=UPI001FDB9EDB|nr:uncharacterized protein JN550_009496 [Neoarthrinium moseri]KAI1848440.1 hypothetical protein JX266_005746 [Neoarthrinium moseri]KAI1863385.1 hypothetical protein JN550_009496 [Neoarthrinium moseri]